MNTQQQNFKVGDKVHCSQISTDSYFYLVSIGPNSARIGLTFTAQVTDYTVNPDQLTLVEAYVYEPGDEVYHTIDKCHYLVKMVNEIHNEILLCGPTPVTKFSQTSMAAWVRPEHLILHRSAKLETVYTTPATQTHVYKQFDKVIHLDFPENGYSTIIDMRLNEVKLRGRFAIPDLQEIKWVPLGKVRLYKPGHTFKVGDEVFTPEPVNHIDLRGIVFTVDEVEGDKVILGYDKDARIKLYSSQLTHYEICPPYPSIGLKSRWVVDEQRQQEINEAIKRYVEAGRTVPGEWLDEYNEIVARNGARRLQQDITALEK